MDVTDKIVQPFSFRNILSHEDADVDVGNKQHREKAVINTLNLFIFIPAYRSRLVTPILVARSRVLIVPTLVLRFLLSLVMSSVGLLMFSTPMVRPPGASMLRSA